MRGSNAKYVIYKNSMFIYIYIYIYIYISILNTETSPVPPGRSGPGEGQRPAFGHCPGIQRAVLAPRTPRCVLYSCLEQLENIPYTGNHHTFETKPHDQKEAPPHEGHGFKA